MSIHGYIVTLGADTGGCMDHGYIVTLGADTGVCMDHGYIVTLGADTGGCMDHGYFYVSTTSAIRHTGTTGSNTHMRPESGPPAAL